MYKKHTDSDQMYDYLKKTVKMFECEYCGECCRDNQVFLFQEDFKRISEKHPDIYDMLDKNKSEYYIRNPCGFLDNMNKCSIYDDRPNICEIYPFSISHAYAGIALYMCQMGEKISRKFDEFKIYNQKGKNPINFTSDGSNLNKQITKMVDIDNKTKEILEGKGKKGEIIEIRVSDPRLIKPFYKYLKSHRE